MQRAIHSNHVQVFRHVHIEKKLIKIALYTVTALRCIYALAVR